MENFVLYDEIGNGNKRVVYKGRRKGTIEYVAIHCVDKTKRLQLQNHVRMCHELKHDNIVQFYEWYETTNHLWLVVELCVGDSLRQILSQDTYLPELTVRSFGRDLVTGLYFLHQSDIVYSDLQPSKILLSGGGKLKYSNFCMARIFGELPFPEQASSHTDSSESDQDKFVGSPLYMAPEVLQGSPYSKESDLWSLGCLLYEMFTGVPPFKAVSFELLLEQIINADIGYPVQGNDGTFVKASENLYMLIQGLLQKDPVHRIDWLELCMHPFWEGQLSSLADELEGYTDHDTTSVISLEEDTKSLLSQVTSAGNHVRKDRPETVPKATKGQNLNTQSLDLGKSNKILTNDKSVRSESRDSKAKPAWQDTYKLERGLAVLDLTELPETRSKRKNSPKDARGSYTKSREVKTPVPPAPTSMVSLEDSLNSMSGFADVIPRVGPDLNVIDHLFHPSDLTVSPIADNPRLLKLPVFKWDTQAIPNALFTMDKLSLAGKEELASFISGLFTTFQDLGKTPAGSTGLRQKMHIVAYLVSGAKFDQVSNLIIEQGHCKTLLHELKTSPSNDLKMRLSHLLSVISSSATYIAPAFNMTEVFQIVTEQLKLNFRNVRFKQALLPVLGEFLFFAATQEESEQRLIQGWEPSGATFTVIIKCLQQGEDNIVQHMAAKIIENVTTTTGRHCKKFLNNEVGVGLWNLYMHATTDVEKTTGSSALCRISMHQPTVVQHVAERAGLTSFLDTLFSGTHKTQQAFTTVCVSLLSNAAQAKKILQDSALIQKIVHNLETPSLVLRGKLYLLIAEICMRNQESLLQCCQARLVTYIERDSRKLAGSGKGDKENLKYVHQCLTVVVNNVVSLVPTILDGIMHILNVVSGRHHPNPAQIKQLKQHLPLLSIVLHLVTSPMFRKRIVDGGFLQYIGDLLERIQSIDNGDINLSSTTTQDLAENIMSDVFSIIEAIAQHPPILMENSSCVIQNILPKLADFSSSEDGNIRILSFKLFSDVATLYMEGEADDGSPRKHDPSSEKHLDKVITENFISNFHSLLQDQDPLPAYCLKLLHACAEKQPAVVAVLVERNVIVTLLTMLQTHQHDISSSVLLNIVGILNCILSNRNISFASICEQGLIEYLTSAFIEVATVVDDEDPTAPISPLLLQLLDTLHHVLKNIEFAVKSVLSVGHEMSSSTDQRGVENLLQECKVLAELNGILINLLVFDDNDIQEWACRCLYLSAELFGGEYEDCFEDDNLLYVIEALKQGNRKRQKMLLRIIKRLITCSESIKGVFVKLRTELDTVLDIVGKTIDNDADSKSIRNLIVDIRKLM